MGKFLNAVLGKAYNSPKINNKKNIKKKKKIIHSTKKLKLKSDYIPIDEIALNPDPIEEEKEEEKEEEITDKNSINETIDNYKKTINKFGNENNVNEYDNKVINSNNNFNDIINETTNKIKDMDDEKILSISHLEIKKMNQNQLTRYSQQIEDYDEIIIAFENDIELLDDKIKNENDENKIEKYKKMKYEIGLQWRIYENAKYDYIDLNKKAFKSMQMSHASNIKYKKQFADENLTLNQTIDNYKKTLHTYEKDFIIFKKEINNYEILKKEDKKIIFDLENELKSQKEYLFSGDKEDLNNRIIKLNEKNNGIELANIAFKAQLDLSTKHLKDILDGNDIQINNLKKKIQSDNDISKKLKNKYIKAINDIQAENNKLKDQPKQLYPIISPVKSPVKSPKKTSTEFKVLLDKQKKDNEQKKEEKQKEKEKIPIIEEHKIGNDDNKYKTP